MKLRSLFFLTSFVFTGCRSSSGSILKDREQVTNLPLGLVGTGVSLIAGDFDGDSDIDLIGVSTNSTSIFLFTNIGRARFQRSSPTTLPMEFRDSGVSLAAGDFDGDGDLDFAGVSTNSNSVFLFTNNGRAKFERTDLTTIPMGLVNSGVSLVSGDFDGDGDIDLVGASTNRTSVFLFTNNGRAKFERTDLTTMPMGLVNSGVSLVSGDFDGDGDIDLVGVSTNSTSVYLFTNNGRANFARTTATTLPMKQRDSGVSLVSGDFDGDGDMDLVGVSTSETSVWLFHNIEMNPVKFVPQRIEDLPMAFVQSGVSLASGDFDSDGKYEFVGVTTNNESVFLFKRNQHGKWSRD